MFWTSILIVIKNLDKNLNPCTSGNKKDYKEVQTTPDRNQKMFELSVSTDSDVQLSKTGESIEFNDSWKYEKEIKYDINKLDALTDQIEDLTLSDAESNTEIKVSRPKNAFPLPHSRYFSIDESIKMISSNISHESLCDDIPNGNKSNCYLFLKKESIPRRTNGSLMFYDDCGTYTRVNHVYFYNVAQRKFFKRKDGKYYSQKNKNQLIEITPDINEDDILQINVYDYKLQGSNSFKRRILFSDKIDIILCQYLGQYDVFTEKKRRVDPAIFSKIKENITLKPTEIYKKLIDDKEDDIDLKKIYNIKSRKQQHETENISQILPEYYNLQKLVETDEFVQEYCFKKGNYPTVILFSKHQIKDLNSMLKTHEDLVLAIDRPFNLSFFYATVIVYKNYKVVNAKGNHPIFMGPIFLHRESKFEDYAYFLSSVKAALSNEIENSKFESLHLENVSFGSDQELALAKAIECVFPNAKRLTCYLRLKENIKRKLIDCGVPKETRSIICNQIFSDSGILKSKDEIEKQIMISRLKTICAPFEEFFNYFSKKLLKY